MNLSERIQLILDEARIDQVQLGDAAGVTKGTVNQWLSGQIKSIKLEYAIGIEERYGFSAVWIVLDRKPIRTGEKSAVPDAVEKAGDLRPVAVVAIATFRNDGSWAVADHTFGTGAVPIDFVSRDRGAFAVQCLGDLLSPRVKDREVLVAEPSYKVEPGDEVLLVDKQGRLIFGEFIYEAAGRIQLLSVSQPHGRIAINKDEIEQMVYVRWIGKPARSNA
jgi:transcriptional regulator with XRE-family HTH domain